MSAHLVKSTRLARAAFSCFIVTSLSTLHTVVERAVSVLTFDTVHDVNCLHNVTHAATYNARVLSLSDVHMSNHYSVYMHAYRLVKKPHSPVMN